MGANFRKIVVFDFETDGPDPVTCNPVQVAAIAIDQRKLEIIPNSEFNMMMRPPNIDKSEYFTEQVMDTIKWHAGNQKTTPEAIIAKWKEAPEQGYAWKQFSTYVDKYNWKKNDWFAPIAAGANIREFDLIISERLNEKHSVSHLFWLRDKIDLIDIAFLWLNWVDEPPKKYKVDALREYFGMSTENSHDALVDVKDCANLLCRFLKLHKSLAPKIKFTV